MEEGGGEWQGQGKGQGGGGGGAFVTKGKPDVAKAGSEQAWRSTMSLGRSNSSQMRYVVGAESATKSASAHLQPPPSPPPPSPISEPPPPYQKKKLARQLLENPKSLITQLMLLSGAALWPEIFQVRGVLRSEKN